MNVKVLLTLGFFVCAGLATAQDEKQALKTKLEDKVGTRWIYDDLDKGRQAARESGKPLLVVLRCVK